MNVFYKTFVVAAAMFALLATDAMAYRYHAKSVQVRTGISESVTELYWLGLNEDSVEVWGALKQNDDYAYFWCDIDGKSFSVPETNIEGNVDHTLVEIGFWEKMLLRKIPSGYSQTLFVQVKSDQSGDNVFISFNNAEYASVKWLVRGKPNVKPVGTPCYDALNDVFTQEIKWDYGNLGTALAEDIILEASYDNGETWNRLAWLQRGIDAGHRAKSYTAAMPSDKENVRYRVSIKPMRGLDMCAGGGMFTSEPSDLYVFSKTPVSPDSIPGGTGSSDLKKDTTVVQGIGAAEVSAQRTVNVYDLKGACVASGVTLEKASATLRRGIYVVNNKKVVLGK